MKEKIEAGSVKSFMKEFGRIFECLQNFMFIHKFFIQAAEYLEDPYL
jgi:hypothetical protein